MPLVRRLARPLLAASFVLGGLDQIRDPHPRTPAAESIVGDVPDRVPGVSNTRHLVQLDGAVKVVAGTMLALGRLPRLSALALAGSLVPTTLAAHRFWELDDAGERAAQQQHFVKNAGLLGGLLLAVVDTHGKPSLAWRARNAAGSVKDTIADKVSEIG